MNHCTCLVVGALCMFKWLPCFALLRRKSGNACCNHFFLQKNSGHALPCGSSSSHALNYSLSPTCGTASTWVHQPCTKLLHSKVMVDYPDWTAAVMPNEPSNHKTPSFPAVSWTDEATIISLFSLSFLSWRKSPLTLLLPHFVPPFTLLSQLPLLDGCRSTGRRDVYGSGQNRRGSWYEEAQAPRRDYRRQAQSHRPVQAPLSGIPH